MSFNGADVFQRRRRNNANHRHLTDFASMEPTSFNVGDMKVGIREKAYYMASMEPTSFNVGDIRHDDPEGF